MINDIVVIRGAGDIASGIGHKLHRSGFRVLMLEIAKPLVIRRTVSFATAILENEAVVEDIKAVKVNDVEGIYKAWQANNIAIMVDAECKILNKIKADVLVDAILAKKNLGTYREMAAITIAAGPGFNAGEDVDVVIETHRGHNLARLIFNGYAQEDTGVPGLIIGFGKERLIKSPINGKINNILEIGAQVSKGQIIAYVGNEPVFATLDGVLRGLITNNLEVRKGLKIGDIDPRAIKEYCYTISEKARAVGGGVLEAILYMNIKKDCKY